MMVESEIPKARPATRGLNRNKGMEREVVPTGQQNHRKNREMVTKPKTMVIL